MVMEPIVISTIYALLLVHEMDAIRRKEWKMFVILKDLDDKIAYMVFTILHIPIYCLVLYFTITLVDKTVLYMIIDGFLIVHTVLHVFFEKHKDNQLKNWFSRGLIYGMGVLAVVHMMMLLP